MLILPEKKHFNLCCVLRAIMQVSLQSEHYLHVTFIAAEISAICQKKVSHCKTH